MKLPESGQEPSFQYPYGKDDVSWVEEAQGWLYCDGSDDCDPRWWSNRRYYLAFNEEKAGWDVWLFDSPVTGHFMSGPVVDN